MKPMPRNLRAILCLPAVLLALAPLPAASASFTLDNCGYVQEFGASVPRRVVAIKSTATEMLLALGLEDRILGQAYQDGPPHADWADAYARIPVLSDKLPATEVVLSLEPDLIYSGWESSFAGDALGARQALTSFGIATYVSPAACRTAGYQPEKLSFEDIFDQILEAGRIFAVEERAHALVAAQRGRLAALRRPVKAQTAVWYSSGVKTPYVGAGDGVPQMMLEALGISNIASDLDGGWSSLSWEAVIAADPDLIVLVDASWNSAEDKMKRLAENPATRVMRAVRERRYLTIPFAASEAGVRNVDAVVDLARQLLAYEQ